MKVHQFHVDPACPRDVDDDRHVAVAAGADLLLVFGTPQALESHGWFDALRADFAGARIAGCSTAGNISRRGVTDDTVTVTAVKFDSGRPRIACVPFEAGAGSHAAGLALARALDFPGLGDAIVFGQGVGVNGSALIAGMREGLAPGVRISGGLAGDCGAFRRTLVMTDNGPSDRHMVAIGFDDAHLRVGLGSFGGWHPFGPERQVTHADGNVLHALDDTPALEIYKRYLGDYARDLPASGLLFPFSMRGADRGDKGLIRTILGIDESRGSLILAGDVEPGGYLQLMHASPDDLVDGAESAAERATASHAAAGDRLALLVSCVGRRLVLGDRAEEEVEAVSGVLGPDAICTGFYSNGEIGPSAAGDGSCLHNQTMTLGCWQELA